MEYLNAPIILASATFVAILLLYFAFSSILSALNKDKYILERIEKWSGTTQDTKVSTANSKKHKGFFSWAGKKREKTAAGIFTDTPLFYQWAGIYDPKTIRFYQVLRYVLLATPITGLLASHFVYHRPFNGILLFFAFAAGYFGYFLPVIYLRIIGKFRRKELNRTFPDAMDLLMVCVEAGMGIDSAIRRVSREIHTTSPELAKEFKILSLELKTGKSRNDCLKNLAKRANLPDVENLVSLLIQADKYGTGVANALRVHAEEMRQKRYNKLEELAAKLPVKLVVPLIIFIFPALFVVIAGPAAIQVFRVIIQGQ